MSEGHNTVESCTDARALDGAGREACLPDAGDGHAGLRAEIESMLAVEPELRTCAFLDPQPADDARPASAAGTLTPGERIGAYRILDTLDATGLQQVPHQGREG